ADDLHYTIRGRRVELDPTEQTTDCSQARATPQFEIDDDRPPGAVADQLRSQGFDPVWKDWDREILAPAPA
ncbi:MAG TPA: 2-iminoacetate synthase ThiH, partial [Verrucomicrobiales bacterium]|nr:2-iminoacetate synthase ThiH [Verrucomicrobiales bacterium]